MPEAINDKRPRPLALPTSSRASLLTLILAGAMATAAFDALGQGLSPMFGYASLSPVDLANNVIQVVFGAANLPGAHMLHSFAGLVAYPLGWMVVARPLAKRIAPDLPWWIAAAVYGVVLWVFALYVMAHLIAGNRPFLGFAGITWVALIGHVIYAWVGAGVVEWRDRS